MTGERESTVRIVWAACGLAAGVVLSALAFLAWRNLPNASAPALDAPAVVREIQRLNDLVSVKYTIQKAIGLEENKVPLGSEKLLLIVQAEVLAGVDLSKISAADVQPLSARRLQVVLPPPKIISVVIDDKQTKVWDRRITWWTPWVPFDPDLERKARLQAKDEIERAALDMGILDQAQHNAEIEIRGLLERFGVTLVPAGGALDKSP